VWRLGDTLIFRCFIYAYVSFKSGSRKWGPRVLPAQLANESFRADHVRFGNSIGAVVQVLMRRDIPATETFFRDHLRVSPTGQKISAEAKAMGRS
jgi:hypothetical protein